ncbi:MAG: pyrimidine 5'-nucleotidase [Anaerolineae bacterium]|nr:pyrimidine 5'-nucleotidase [Anaerolineae bacterium]
MSDRDLHFVLFDLDDTLYPRQAGVMRRIHELMDDWMVQHLGLGRDEVSTLRSRLYRQYGTTMAGLLAERQINADDFLEYVHNFDPKAFLSPDPALRQALERIPLRRVVFTNGTRAHAQRVLDALGITSAFEQIIDVADVGYVSKPALLAYQRALDILGARPEMCILVEDSPRNLVPAREMGMLTILVGDRADEVADYRAVNVLQAAVVIQRIVLDGGSAGRGGKPG